MVSTQKGHVETVPKVIQCVFVKRKHGTPNTTPKKETWNLKILLEKGETSGCFPKKWVPQNGWFIMENPMNKWMIWEKKPYFWKHPHWKLLQENLETCPNGEICSIQEVLIQFPWSFPSNIEKRFSVCSILLAPRWFGSDSLEYDF